MSKKSMNQQLLQIHNMLRAVKSKWRNKLRERGEELREALPQVLKRNTVGLYDDMLTEFTDDMNEVETELARIVKEDK